MGTVIWLSLNITFYTLSSSFLFVCLVVFNTTFNNISVISWWSVLLVEETGGPEENLSQITDKLSHIMLYISVWSRFELTTSVVIGTDCRGSCKSNYHMITTTTAPFLQIKEWCCESINYGWYLSVGNVFFSYLAILASCFKIVLGKLELYLPKSDPDSKITIF